MKTLLFLVLVGVAQFNIADGKRKRVFFREVKPTTSDAIIRSQRGIIARGYQNKVVEQHNDATVQLEENRRATQATQFLVENLQESIRLRQQLGNQAQMPIAPGLIRLVDQYGNEVSGMMTFQFQPTQAVQNLGGYSYPVPQLQPPSITQTLPQMTETDQSRPAEVQNAYLPPQPKLQPQPQVQIQPQPQLLYSQAQYLPQPVYYQPQEPQPQYLQAQPQPQFLQPQLQPQAPVLQQFVTPEGLIFHQLVEQPQPLPQPQEVVYHHLQPQQIQVQYHHPQTTVVQQQEHHQIYHHPIPVPLPAVVETIQPKLPVVEKVIAPVVSKTVLPIAEEVPTVKLVKQPILTPADFQKEIFAVKNPPVRVLTYSDLCTVYPYQRKLSACVYKKAAIPELHHPDIQLVPEQTNVVTPTPVAPPPKAPVVENGGGYGEGKINPRTSPLKLHAPTFSDRMTTGSNAGSIQDILRGGHKNSATSTSTESSSEGGEELDDEIPIVEEHENTNIAESSNKKEKLVIRTTKPHRVSLVQSTSRPKKSGKPKNVPSTTKVPPTAKTTPNTPSSTRKPKKSKRRSRNSKARRAERRKQRNLTSTEQPFKLA